MTWKDIYGTTFFFNTSEKCQRFLEWLPSRNQEFLFLQKSLQYEHYFFNMRNIEKHGSVFVAHENVSIPRGLPE